MKIKVIFFVLLLGCWGQQVLCMELVKRVSEKFLSKSKTKQDLLVQLKQINETSTAISAELKKLQNEFEELKNSVQNNIQDNVRINNFPLDPNSLQESMKYDKRNQQRLAEQLSENLKATNEQIKSIQNLVECLEESKNALKNKVDNEVLLKNDKEFENLKKGLAQMEDAHKKVQYGMSSFKEDFLKFQSDFTGFKNELTSFKEEQATNQNTMTKELQEIKKKQDELDKKITQGVPLTRTQKQMMIGFAVIGIALGGLAVVCYYKLFQMQKA